MKIMQEDFLRLIAKLEVLVPCGQRGSKGIRIGLCWDCTGLEMQLQEYTDRTVKINLDGL